ncbi:hypothetical protein M422DRAFT_59253 [Sphaerobolus stellatus SS14]|nr:hypothetical protein M422DRAFT_59253 [Sphaerobolus stellatus SS14]
MEISPDISSVNLTYRIFKSTGHSGRYVPENIQVDNPMDQTSRWSGAHHSSGAKQWLILELKEPSIIRNITFGKFHKPHPCNMKEFTIAIGRTTDSLTTVLTGSLINNNIPETFEVPSPSKAQYDVPVRYVKIIPASAHSPSFHTSIWHISIYGISDPTIISAAEDAYENYREGVALRHVLKYLRRRRHLTSFNSLLFRTRISFEHPTITALYDTLMSGDWANVESLVESAAQGGLFDDYIKSYPPKAIWKRIDGADMDGDIPCARGGHQMCFDTDSSTIYLHGGWDGRQNLEDFWTYSLTEGRWNLLSARTSVDGGPSPRSCHQMVFDPKTGYIYILGCYPNDEGIHSDRQVVSSDGMDVFGSSGEDSTQYKPDFYRYATRGPQAGTWKCLSQDTQRSGGPRLIHDHQMVIDSDSQLIYVFGGHIIIPQAETDIMKFSGLFEYDIVHGIWREFALFGHSMLFTPNKRQLFIMGGRKNGVAYLPDMYTYDLNTQTVKNITTDFTSMGGPDPCFCQRAALDPQTGHIFVYSSDIEVKTEENMPTEPPPRYAHQMVYDHVRKQFFVHGGTAGQRTDSRLDDFWSMTLEQPSIYEIIRRARFIIRRQQFKELCETVPAVQALIFLQRHVHDVVDHSSDEEAARFRSLHSHLFGQGAGVPKQEDIHMAPIGTIGGSNEAEGSDRANVTPERFRERTQVFEDLLKFFDIGQKEPDKDLLDILAGSENGEPMLL